MRYHVLWISLPCMFAATMTLSSLALHAQTLDHSAHASSKSLTEDQDSTPSSRAISGTVFDPSGAAIANAQLSLLSSGDKLVAQTATDSSGSFRIDRVVPGNYTLDFQAEGFRDTRVNVNLSAKRQSPIRVVAPVPLIWI